MASILVGGTRPVVACPAHSRVCARSPVAVSAEKGFGQNLPKKSDKGLRQSARIEKQLGDASEAPLRTTRAAKPRGEYWFKAANLSELAGKDKKAIITQTGTSLMLYVVDDQAYCTDAKSTAFSYPLVDAKVFTGPTGPAVEVPLDGTQYDLATGAVLSWCPGDNPVQKFLGALKKDMGPIPLPTYDCVLTYEDEIYVKLTK